MKEADRQTPNKAQGVFGILGSAMLIGSYFLPNYYTVASGTTQPTSPSDYSMITSWDIVSVSLSGDRVFVPQVNSYVAGQPHIFTFVVAAFPLVVAALLLILSVWAIAQRSGPVRSAIFSAAVVVLAIWAFSASAGLQTSSFTYSGNFYQAGPLLSLGTCVYLVGVFVTIVAAALSYQRR